jgi:hypothetical protein
MVLRYNVVHAIGQHWCNRLVICNVTPDSIVSADRRVSATLSGLAVASGSICLTTDQTTQATPRHYGCAALEQEVKTGAARDVFRYCCVLCGFDGADAEAPRLIGASSVSRFARRQQSR